MLALIICSLLSATITGKVVSVHDEDTITVLQDSTQIKVRLAEIDAPELKQAFGQRARQALGERLQGKQVRVEWEKRDKYGRTLGTVYLGEESINLWQVRNGWAWQYKQYSKSETLKRAEEQARKEKVGLWQDVNPVPPWEWRKKK